MDQDHNIRLKLQASMEGKNVVAEQLNSLLSIEKQLTEQNYKLAEAAKTRAAAAEASASRERALVQGVVSIQGELAEANRRAEEAAKRAAEAAKARAEANKREAEREKGILENLKAKYAEVEKARERAMSHKEIRQYNAQLSDLQRQIARVDGGMRGLGQTTVGTSNQFRTLHNYATAALSTAALTQFGNKLKDVTSNAESFGISLETMLQSKLNADKLNSQVIDFAKRTPFTLGEVQEQTTKLLAYNIASGDVVKTIEELGNIAAGVGKEKLPFLTLAYGQVRALGRLTGQEVRQFTEAGVPLLELLAKQSGKTTAQIQKDVTEGAVSFEMVKAAISSTSAEGGKFFNLMGKQSQTLAGRLSNFSDTVDQGLVRVGNRLKQTGMNLLGMADDFIQASLGSESAVNRTISYIKALIAMYVTYRAVSAAITVQKRLEVAADLELVGSHRLLYAVTGQLNLAQQGLWATLRANPIGLIVGAIGLAVTAYQLWKGASTEVVSAIGEEEGKLRAERDTLNALTSAVVTANAANGERIRVLKNLNEQYPDLLRGLDLEKVSNRELVNILAAVNREYKNRIENARLAYQPSRTARNARRCIRRSLISSTVSRKPMPISNPSLVISPVSSGRLSPTSSVQLARIPILTSQI
ncbi:hypothetical protein BWI93_05375 [Siphonobacter sp. BAB-5385]|uniref:tape measure protein n=1 Tax=Siphonobacter sp. BAB-5385 TaxID=1864822 RepID=UPI000B9E9EFA|nr:tape measure protein [Siphonobacter sp. BAB-5385]OZI09178.1 hypothetical protein BWI93_05375 [Siphonobacter sp. BAB-5385]